MTTSSNIFGTKEVGIDYPERIGAYGISFNSTGEVAVVETAGKYFLPGGGIEGEETHEECLEREFLEETGHEVIIHDFICTAAKYHHSLFYKTDMLMTGYFYLVTIGEKIAVPIEKDHTLMWLPYEKALESLFLEHQAWVVQQAKKAIISI